MGIRQRRNKRSTYRVVQVTAHARTHRSAFAARTRLNIQRIILLDPDKELLKRHQDFRANTHHRRAQGVIEHFPRRIKGKIQEFVTNDEAITGGTDDRDGHGRSGHAEKLRGLGLFMEAETRFYTKKLPGANKLRIYNYGSPPPRTPDHQFRTRLASSTNLEIPDPELDLRKFEGIVRRTRLR